MVLTTRQVAEALGIPREVAAKLMPRLPGARQEAVRPGAIPGWVADDDVLNTLGPMKLQELIDEARAEVQTSALGGAGTRPTAAGPPARSPLAADLADEEAAIRREELELRRLRILAEKRRLEEQEAQRRPAGPGTGDVMRDMFLFDQIRELKQQLAEVHKKSELGALAQVFAPVLPKLAELLAGRPALGLQEVLALVKNSQTNPVELLEQIKKLGGLDSGGLAQTEQLVKTVEAVRAVAKHLAGEGGEGESVWAEVVRSVGPELGRIGNNLVETWGKAIDVRRKELELRLGRAGARTGAAAAVMRLNDEIARAAAALDDAFFPRLVERLSSMFEGRGREFLAAVQSGQVGEAEAFETLAGVGLVTPKTFLKRFFNWLKAGARPQPAAPPSRPQPAPGDGTQGAPGETGRGQIIAACTKCPSEFAFDSEGAWARDDHVCDAVLEDGRPCGGTLVRKAPNA